jgi:hypothetical protein
VNAHTYVWRRRRIVNVGRVLVLNDPPVEEEEEEEEEEEIQRRSSAVLNHPLALYQPRLSPAIILLTVRGENP